MTSLEKIIQEKPFLAWYVQDYKKLDDISALEAILNYGDWDDFIKAKDILGFEKTKQVFQIIKGKKRVNLKPKTINLFELYFSKNVS